MKSSKKRAMNPKAIATFVLALAAVGVMGCSGTEGDVRRHRHVRAEVAQHEN